MKFVWYSKIRSVTILAVLAVSMATGAAFRVHADDGNTVSGDNADWDVTSAPLVVEDPAKAPLNSEITPSADGDQNPAADQGASDNKPTTQEAGEVGTTEGRPTTSEANVGESSPDAGSESGSGRGTPTMRGVAPKAEVDIEGETTVDQEEDLTHKLSANYFAILYGSSVTSPGQFQPSPFGDRDPSRPVELKNFAGLSYNFDKDTSLTPTAYWSWYAGQQQLTMNDPFLRLSRANVIDTKYFNLYSDIRVHFPVSAESQQDHLMTGIQTFQSLSYQVAQTPLALGLYASARMNFFGDNGLGNDFEFYMGPNMFFQIAKHASLTLLFEEQLNHEFGARPFHFWTPGSDLEPGVAWDVTPNLMLNPYLNLNTGGQVALSTTSFGMMLNLRMF